MNYKFLESDINFFNPAFFENQNPKKYSHSNSALDQY